MNRPERVDAIDGALGELSPFHAAFGFYVHGVSLESVSLPVGWESRTVPVTDPVRTRGNTGHCLEAHDLAASKLAAYREKDREFVTTLLAEGIIDPHLLSQRLADLPVEGHLRQRMARWVRATASELRAS